MLRILRGFRKGDAIPPVAVFELPDATKFRYRLHDGFHRFYASIAVRFSRIPACIRTEAGRVE